MNAVTSQELVSGMWDGYYEDFGRRFPQRMRLEFADGIVRGDGTDGLGMFLIDGEYRIHRRELLLGWVKTYEGAHSVLYLGSFKFPSIVGNWSLCGAQGGFGLTPEK